MKLFYWYSKFIRKYVIGKSIRNSLIDKTAKIASGSLVSDVKLGRYSYSGYDCWYRFKIEVRGAVYDADEKKEMFFRL